MSYPNLYPGAITSLSVKEFYKTFSKVTEGEVKEELESEEGLRLLGALDDGD